MKGKLSLIVASALVVATLVPGMVLAAGKNEHRGGVSLSALAALELRARQLFTNDLHAHATASGTVSAVGSSSFDFKTGDGTTYTVQSADATLHGPIGVIHLSDIKVNDKVWVRGTLNDLTFSKAVVTDVPPNTHPATIRNGKVTAVNGNTLTVQMNTNGIVSNVTVNTNSQTTVTKRDSTSPKDPGTLADVTVGAMVRVRGLWDELLNDLNALTIHIK